MFAPTYLHIETTLDWEPFFLAYTTSNASLKKWVDFTVL